MILKFGKYRYSLKVLGNLNIKFGIQINCVIYNLNTYTFTRMAFRKDNLDRLLAVVPGEGSCRASRSTFILLNQPFALNSCLLVNLLIQSTSQMPCWDVVKLHASSLNHLSLVVNTGCWVVLSLGLTLPHYWGKIPLNTSLNAGHSLKLLGLTSGYQHYSQPMRLSGSASYHLFFFF